MITVACVWVRGQVPFGLDYVTKLERMVTRHLRQAHQFVCLTDRPWQIPDGIRSIPVSTPPRKGWWAKVELFNRAHGWTGRLLYLDLDTLVVDSLDPLVDMPASFVLAPPGGSFTGDRHLATVRRYNSSVMTWDAGTQDALFDKWTARVTDRLWGDQDWIGEQVPSAAVFPEAWCPRLSSITGPPFGEAKVILAKVPKNTEAAQRWPWFAERWQ